MRQRDLKQKILYWGAFLNRRGMASGPNGNLSCKAGAEGILMTAHRAHLGHLTEKEILLTDAGGRVLEGEGEPTAEQALHLALHRRFPEIRAVIHAHPPYTTALFHYVGRLQPFSVEVEVYLGAVQAVTLETAPVIDTEPVLRALETSRIAVLKEHGVVAVGGNFREAAGLVEILEEQAKVDLLIHGPRGGAGLEDAEERRGYSFLSEEHVARLVDLVNGDARAQSLGEKYHRAFTLALQAEDTGEVVRFHCQGGRIVKTDQTPEADFLFSDRREALERLLNRETDLLAVLSRAKRRSDREGSRIMEWYPLLVRIFKVWGGAPAR